MSFVVEVVVDGREYLRKMAERVGHSQGYLRPLQVFMNQRVSRTPTLKPTVTQYDMSCDICESPGVG